MEGCHLMHFFRLFGSKEIRGLSRTWNKRINAKILSFMFIFEVGEDGIQ